MKLGMQVGLGPGRIVLAICCRPSACRLSITFVRPSQAVEIFGSFYAIWYLDDPLTSTENFTEIIPWVIDVGKEES